MTCVVYSYWEGENRHWLYDLCWQTVTRHTPGARLLTREDVEQVLGPLPKELDNAYVTHRVDWIRKMWIYKMGGLWVDMDFICWSDLTPLGLVGRCVDYLGYKEWHGTGWIDSFFAARIGSPILKDAADYALQQIRASGPAIQWLAASAHAMNHAMERHRWSLWIQLPTHIVSPISVMEKDWFTAEEYGIDVSSFNSFGQIISFHGIGDWVKGRFRGPDELLASHTRLAALLRRGLGL